MTKDPSQERKNIEEENLYLLKAADLDKKELSPLANLISDKEETNHKEKLHELQLYENTISNNLKRINKDIKFYEENTKCPTCDQDICETHRDEILNKSNTKKEEYIKGLDVIRSKIKKLEEKLSDIKLVKAKIEKLEDRLSQIKTKISVTKQYVSRLEAEKVKLLEPASTGKDEEKKLKEFREELKVQETELEKLSNSKLIHEIASNMLKDGGIKALIIKQYLPVINKLVNRFLNSMNFYIRFHIDENFNESIRNVGKDVLTYHSLSDGQKQRLNIAILLAWRNIAMMKNSVNTNLLFVDELLDSSLDQISAENIIDLITHEPALKNSNIFVISHKPQVIDKFCNCIRFSNVKNFSRITVEEDT